MPVIGSSSAIAASTATRSYETRLGPLSLGSTRPTLRPRPTKGTGRRHLHGRKSSARIHTSPPPKSARRELRYPAPTVLVHACDAARRVPIQLATGTEH